MLLLGKRLGNHRVDTGVAPGVQQPRDTEQSHIRQRIQDVERREDRDRAEDHGA
jgi:hypothetical protein